MILSSSQIAQIQSSLSNSNIFYDDIKAEFAEQVLKTSFILPKILNQSIAETKELQRIYES